MAASSAVTVSRPSLEGLLESGLLNFDSFHPGGLSLTWQLAERCRVRPGDRVLDVACGSGESACFLAQRLQARCVGIDYNDALLGHGRDKAAARGLDVRLLQADAHRLPFPDGSFDAVICECTLCFLDKAHVLAEMARVTRPGGCVGMHDLCWSEKAPDRLKQLLDEIEGEQPETLDGWVQQFRDAGLVDVETVDESALKANWMDRTRRELGVHGLIRLGLGALRRWGIGGLITVLRSERVFADPRLGYVMVVGTRPAPG